MKLLRNDFFVSFLILVLYFLTNSYIYAWDDQHLEIPLLKHLIDPSLYKGDYYVEGLARNFTSYLYPILAKCIKIDQIPTAYAVLFVLARYAMFFWVYRLWQLIAQNRFAALIATLMMFLFSRSEEFVYRTFSHQELGLAFVFAGFYYFYKERYVLAAAIFGFAANIHAIYSLFPMVYLLGYLLVFHQRRWSMVFKSGLTFVFLSLPFLCWQIPRAIQQKVAGVPVPLGEWMPLYLLSCPQNFLFQATPLVQVLKDPRMLLDKMLPFVSLTALYIFHVLFNPAFRRDQKAHAIVLVSWALVAVAYVFSYVYPSRFFIDLNLIRVEQYVRFLLVGYSAIFAIGQARAGSAWLAVMGGLFFLSLGLLDALNILGVLLAALGFGIYHARQRMVSWPKAIMWVIILSALAAVIYLWGMELKSYAYIGLIWVRFKYVVLGVGIVSVLVFVRRDWAWLRHCLVIVPLAGMFIYFAQYHYDYLKLKKTSTGFWQMYRNWVDMQKYVKAHTPKDALIMTPYNTDTGGFRIYSERRVLVCYRDCGIIGFDYQAARTWQERIKDIEAFKLYTSQPVDRAVLNAILKYHVDYIVFMNYYQPSADNPVFNKLYQNEVFSLYGVKGQ